MKRIATNCLSVLSVLLFVVVVGHSQTTISGVVSDASSNETLIGANVLVLGTSIGTITDIDGSYSLNVPAGSNVLEVSYAGYANQSINIDGRTTINVALGAGTLLDEIVVVGYGSQSEKEITSSVVKLDNKDFNKGAISDPTQLLQGKVAGLQVYNRGGDPNGAPTIRLRGISTVGANTQPLVVVDGIIGASLNNVDPNDIENISVLKDGSAAAIYGSRGSSGVIIVTTKKGTPGDKIKLTYNGQVSTSSAVNSVSILDATEFVAAGGTDLGSQTDWLEEVTRTGFSHLHGLSASGGVGASSNFRIAANVRQVDGILQNSGFDQFNTRLNFSTRALNDKLKIDFNTSYTKRDQQNGFNEGLRYAVLYNPTAPVLGENSLFPFNSPQFGGYFETLGLFDSFNPASVVNQNINNGERNEFNYGVNLGYSILDNLTANFRVAKQTTDYSNRLYYPTTSLFNGNATSPTRKGSAEFYESNASFDLYEAYATYTTDIGGSSNLSVTGGYSYQQEDFNDFFTSLGDFPNNDLNFLNLIETSQDLQNAGFIGASSNITPVDGNRIIAFFGRANYTYDNAIFLNASLRQEGSSKLGADNKWGLFPALGVGVDLNNYLGLGGVDQLKLRVGYGVTGSLPVLSGLSQEIRQLQNFTDGGVGNTLLRAANPDLKFEEKAETNIGIEFATGKLSATLDVYTRNISDFILERTVEVSEFGVDRRFENAGKLKTNGLELALNYDVATGSNFTYNTGIVLSTYKTTLEEYVLEQETRANLGAPGQNGTNVIRVKVGEEIGQIWGPVFESVGEDGAPIFADVNGDGMLNTDQGNALADDVDFEVLGNGTPDFELGWTNQITFGKWSVNAFFRGAFGHSLVNTFRAFYEPRVSSQTSYNFVSTDKAVDGLTSAQFSSLYVEKADFIKLDNLTIGRSFDLNNNYFDGLQLSLIFQNPLVITGYSGADPEPALNDSGPAGNGGRSTGNDVLSPGLDRRNSYFAQRSVTLGVNLNF
ncbi:MAG: TonB-linked SusC/RagA family outer membrane protein [Saprospiraceae bacterium]|jgi:TonB-linked SusC/RagA family outer membrane protein